MTVLRPGDFHFRSQVNYDFLLDLEDKGITRYDWLGTVVFYIALHRVRAVLARDHGINYKLGHDQLNNFVIEHLTDIADSYEFLYTESRRYRYELKENENVTKETYEEVKKILFDEIFPKTQFGAFA